ncbi:MAG: transposase, partial [Candidatus Midichloria mitochondrii]|nr:transposase [Candidatus Midichloria mitochondrii]
MNKTSTGWFFGLNDQGEIMSFTLTSGNTDDR